MIFNRDDINTIIFIREDNNDGGDTNILFNPIFAFQKKTIIVKGFKDIYNGWSNEDIRKILSKIPLLDHYSHFESTFDKNQYGYLMFCEIFFTASSITTSSIIGRIRDFIKTEVEVISITNGLSRVNALVFDDSGAVKIKLTSSMYYIGNMEKLKFRADNNGVVFYNSISKESDTPMTLSQRKTNFQIIHSYTLYTYMERKTNFMFTIHNNNLTIQLADLINTSTVIDLHAVKERAEAHHLPIISFSNIRLIIDTRSISVYDLIAFLAFFNVVTVSNVVKNRIIIGDEVKCEKEIHIVEKIIERAYTNNNLIYLKNKDNGLKTIKKQNNVKPVKKIKKEDKVVKQTTKPSNIEGETQNIGGTTGFSNLF